MHAGLRLAWFANHAQQLLPALPCSDALLRVPHAVLHQPSPYIEVWVHTRLADVHVPAAALTRSCQNDTCMISLHM